MNPNHTLMKPNPSGSGPYPTFLFTKPATCLLQGTGLHFEDRFYRDCEFYCESERSKGQ